MKQIHLVLKPKSRTIQGLRIKPPKSKQADCGELAVMVIVMYEFLILIDICNSDKFNNNKIARGFCLCRRSCYHQYRNPFQC